MYVAFILPAIRCETDCILDADCCTVGTGGGGMVDITGAGIVGAICAGCMIDTDDCGCAIGCVNCCGMVDPGTIGCGNCCVMVDPGNDVNDACIASCCCNN